MNEAFTDEQKRELSRLVTHLRALVSSSVALTAPLEVLTEMADAAEALAARARPFTGERPFPAYTASADADISAIMPWSVISGPLNPLAAPVAMTLDHGTAVGEVRFGLAHEGPPGGVHGAVVASVYDEVLALAGFSAGVPGHTVTLTTHYRAVTPLHVDLRFEGWIDRTEGRRVYTRGRCLAAGAIVSEAEALFITYKHGFPGTVKPDASSSDRRE